MGSEPSTTGESRDGHGDRADATATPLIRCTDVTHDYRRGGRSRRVPWRRRHGAPTVRALDGVSLTVEAGDIVGLAGPSGSGKSTLLYLLSGLTTPTGGSITVAGTSLDDLSNRARTRFRYATVGFVFQRFHLLPSLSARANVALPLIQAGIPRSTRRERATALLDRVGLGDRALHTPGRLSGGEQQRVAIARALVTDPDVILADEPTGELDTATSEQVLELLTDLATDEAVVIASHDETALAATDRVVSLQDGRLAARGAEP